MIKKQGITLVTVVVTIIVLSILAGAITISTSATLNYARLSTWANEIAYIQDVVKESEGTMSTFPYTEDKVTIDVLGMSNEEIQIQFPGEIISDDAIELNILNLGVLKITNTEYGRRKTANDVYAYSVTTGRVYYAKGLEIDGYIYYSVTDALRDRFDLAPVNDELSAVVFIPSAIGYTNDPITVKLKLPSTFTNINITTSNTEIQVGAQTIVDNTYEYVINTNNVAGNYEVTVSYTNGEQSYTSKYTVNSYDVTKPVINPIVYGNIVTVDNTDYLKSITATDNSGIKYFKYTPGMISNDEAQAYFQINGNNVVGGKINLSREATQYTLYAEDNAGNFTILTFDTKYVMKEEWVSNVTQIIDGVPIPKGFVASPYTGENKKESGLVIYELESEETQIPDTEDKFTSWTERNQYVWVPVDDFTKFVRQNFDRSDSIVTDDIGVEGYWEVILDTANMPDVAKNTAKSRYMTVTTRDGGITNTLAEVQAMYASVKEYGGFYIARYEAGLDIGNHKTSDDKVIIKTVHSKMNKAPYNYIQWASFMDYDTKGVVVVARGIYPVNDESNTTGVVSTLIYGVQWDRTLAWYLETNAMALNDVSSDSIAYGNYMDHDILSYTELNPGAQYSSDDGINYTHVTDDYIKGSDKANEPHLLTTGALKAAKINNIYDMAGNVMEWTMEGFSSDNRIYRGGRYGFGGDKEPISDRSNYYPNYAYEFVGFRPALYIKI